MKMFCQSDQPDTTINDRASRANSVALFGWDLTQTWIASGDAAARPPDEGELHAILTALLELHHMTYGDFASSHVQLTEDNHQRVAALIEQRIPTIGRALGADAHTRLLRLQQLVGLRTIRLEEFLAQSPTASGGHHVAQD